MSSLTIFFLVVGLVAIVVTFNIKATSSDNGGAVSQGNQSKKNNINYQSMLAKMESLQQEQEISRTTNRIIDSNPKYGGSSPSIKLNRNF